jgi:hypothetical protein
VAVCSSPSRDGSLLRDSPGFSPDSLFNHAGKVNHLPVGVKILCKGNVKKGKWRKEIAGKSYLCLQI